MSERVTELMGKDFESFIKGETVVVDFFADWCMPCVMMAPVIDEMAEKFAEIKFAKIDIEDNKSLAEKMRVGSIPTLILFKKGKEIRRIIGARPASELESELGEFIK